MINLEIGWDINDVIQSSPREPVITDVSPNFVRMKSAMKGERAFSSRIQE